MRLLLRPTEQLLRRCCRMGRQELVLRDSPPTRRCLRIRCRRRRLLAARLRCRLRARSHRPAQVHCPLPALERWRSWCLRARPPQGLGQSLPHPQLAVPRRGLPPLLVEQLRCPASSRYRAPVHPSGRRVRTEHQLLAQVAQPGQPREAQLPGARGLRWLHSVSLTPCYGRGPGSDLRCDATAHPSPAFAGGQRRSSPESRSLRWTDRRRPRPAYRRIRR